MVSKLISPNGFRVLLPSEIIKTDDIYSPNATSDVFNCGHCDKQVGLSVKFARKLWKDKKGINIVYRKMYGTNINRDGGEILTIEVPHRYRLLVLGEEIGNYDLFVLKGEFPYGSFSIENWKKTKLAGHLYFTQKNKDCFMIREITIPPDNWKIVKVGEIIQYGDMFSKFGGSDLLRNWKRSFEVGKPQQDNLIRIRKDISKPIPYPDFGYDMNAYIKYQNLGIKENIKFIYNDNGDF